MSVNPNGGRLRRQRMDWERDFTQLPNNWLRDKRLSWGARGIIAWLQSHDSDFEVTLDSLAAASNQGNSAVRAAVRELEHFGYLKRYRERLAKGRLGGTIWHQIDPFRNSDPTRNQLDMTNLVPITDRPENPRSEPTGDYPPVDSPPVDSPPVGNRTTIEDHLEELSIDNTSTHVTRREDENRELLDSERRYLEQRAAAPNPADYLEPWTDAEAQLADLARELPCSQGRVHRIPENVRCCTRCTASFAVLERQAMNEIHADRTNRRYTQPQEETP